GSGIAGLSFVLDLLERRPGLSVLLVSKDKLGEGNSRYAQGGIASVALADDSIDSHVEDTLEAGDGLCLESVVRKILEEAPRCMARLIERGVEFDRQPDASYDLALEGGHSHRRIHHSGDRTGEAIIDTLLARVRQRDEVRILDQHTAVGLIRRTGRHAPGSASEVRGAHLLEGNSGPIHSITARMTVLATGGAGKVYRYTSNSELSTGDGVAMCYRAGARVGNLEFYQFHPTLLYHPEVNNFLITEAIRGEGAYLCLPDGERFMARHQPEKMELATRDKVVRAIFTEMERGTYDHVCLDVRHLDPAKLKAHFPLIGSTLSQLGIDVGRQMIPTVPAAHYMCGGVLTDAAGRTDLDRLFVIGESAFTGLHGANRLASNSLIEGVVMASLASTACDEWLDQPPSETKATPWDSPSHIDDRRGSQLNAHWRGLRNEMTSFAGIVRTEAGLRDLLTIIGARREMIEEYYWTHWMTRDLVELRDIALVAELIARSALHRRESRGGHFREDYPLPVPDTQDTILRFQEEFPIQSNLFERP
ncbi:MAG: L-aspartate oxidase, partial [Planctomycetota bacterium]